MHLLMYVPVIQLLKKLIEITDDVVFNRFIKNYRN